MEPQRQQCTVTATQPRVASLDTSTPGMQASWLTIGFQSHSLAQRPMQGAKAVTRQIQQSLVGQPRSKLHSL